MAIDLGAGSDIAASIDGSEDSSGRDAEAGSDTAVDGAPDAALDADAATDGAADGQAPAPMLRTLAGDPGGPGTADDTGAAARLNNPAAIVFDAAGNAYVSDSGSCTIRKMAATSFQVSTVAGIAGTCGVVDGRAGTGALGGPGALALDGGGNLYVADTMNAVIRRVAIATGEIVTVAGAAAGFVGVSGLAFNGTGATDLYVSDEHAIKHLVIATGAVTIVAGAATAGSLDAVGTAARFSRPGGITSDGAGSLYVADAGNHTIRKVVLASGAVTTLAGTAGASGAIDATAGAARFKSPVDVAFAGGNLYVMDQANSLVRKIVVSTATVTTVAGSAGVVGDRDGVGTEARFNFPAGLALNGTSELYVADFFSDTIRRVALGTGTVTTVAGSSLKTGSADGTGTVARFFDLDGVASDDAGNVYVSDGFNATIRRIVVATGETTTFVGTAGAKGGRDGVGPAAQLSAPRGIAFDGGNLYVADPGSYTIRKVVIATRAVTTVAGSPGVAGDTDGVGAAALFTSPTSIVADGAGSLYVGDIGSYRIRKVALGTGTVSTVLTKPADTFYPYGLALDGGGALLIADPSAAVISRMELPNGALTVLAGTPGMTGSDDGVGSAATFVSPRALAADGLGNVYVADFNVVRKLALATAAVTSVVGVRARVGVKVGPLPGSLNAAVGVAAIPGGGGLIIDDFAENVVLLATF